MKRQDLVVALAMTMLASSAFAKDSNNDKDREPASAKTIAECVDTLKGIVAANETAHVEDYPSITKDVKISHVSKIAASPCAGGADGCMYTTASGDVGDKVMSGHFVVTAGRGSCFVKMISLHAAE